MKKIRVKWSGHDLDLLALTVIEQAARDAHCEPGEERAAAREWLDSVGREWLEILGVKRQSAKGWAFGEQKRYQRQAEVGEKGAIDERRA